MRDPSVSKAYRRQGMEAVMLERVTGAYFSYCNETVMITIDTFFRIQSTGNNKRRKPKIRNRVGVNYLMK